MKNFIKCVGIIAFVALIGFSLAACKKDAVDGTTWKGIDDGDEYTLTFKSPGFTISTRYETQTGTYTISGNSLSLSTRGFSAGGAVTGKIITIVDDQGYGINFVKQ